MSRTRGFLIAFQKIYKYAMTVLRVSCKKSILTATVGEKVARGSRKLYTWILKCFKMFSLYNVFCSLF